MIHELKKVEHSAVEIKIALNKEEVAPIKEKIVAELAKVVEVPGFRKGNAPASKIEAEFKDRVEDEIVKEILKENLNNIVESEKVKPVSYVYDMKTSTENGFEINFKLDIYPEVTLGEYKGLTAEKESFEMNDEVLNKEIENILASRSKLEEAVEGYKAEMGDIVDLAFEGFVDGVAFDGGKADSYQLKLGTKSFIDTFEEQLVGYVAGQEGEVNVIFPAEYHVKDLAGKPAVFKVKINSIKRVVKPELTDELAKEFGFESVEDLKTKMTENIKTREENRVKNTYVGKLLQQIVANSKMDIPSSMVVREIENRLAEMEQQLSMQGMNLDQYFKMTGMTREQAFNQIAPMAHNKVQIDLVLAKIAEVEKLEISKEELDNKMEEIAKMYKMEKTQLQQELIKAGNLENFTTSLQNELLAEKTVDLIIKNAK